MRPYTLSRRRSAPGKRLNDNKDHRGLSPNLVGWLVVSVVVLLCIGLLVFAVVFVTDGYIEAQRERTLIYEPHPLRRHKLLREQLRFKGLADDPSRIQINQFGIRGRAPVEEVAEGHCRIVAMGGSSVFDHLLNDGASWPERIQPELTQLGWQNVETLNAGIPGYSSRETLSFYHDAVRFLEPQALLLYQGWNDVKYMIQMSKGQLPDRILDIKDWDEKYGFLTRPRPIRNFLALPMMLENRGGFLERPAARDSSAGGAPKKPQKRSKKRRPTMEALFDSWRSSPGIAYWRSNLELFVVSALSSGATPVLIAQNTLATEGMDRSLSGKIRYKWIRMSHRNLVVVNEVMVEVMREVAEHYQIPHIDLREAFNGQIEYFSDHVHLLPAGSNRLAEGVARYLHELRMAGRFSCGVNSGD